MAQPKRYECVVVKPTVIYAKVRKTGTSLKVYERDAKNLLTRGRVKLADGEEGPAAHSGPLSMQGDEAVILAQHSTAELREIAESYGLKMPAKANKDQLIAAIEAHEAEAEGEE